MRIKLYSDVNNPEELERISFLLKEGAVMIYPTDTGYALGCSAADNRAIERICAIKKIKNPEKSRFSIICYDMSEISRFARFDNKTFKLMKSILPAPVTFILPGSNLLPKVFRKRKTLGVRMPDNNIDVSIVKSLGFPIMTSSLPLEEGEDIAYATNPELIEEKWGSTVDFVIDGGEIPHTMTTIVDCTSAKPEIVRQGIAEVDL